MHPLDVKLALSTYGKVATSTERGRYLFYDVNRERGGHNHSEINNGLEDYY